MSSSPERRVNHEHGPDLVPLRPGAPSGRDGWSFAQKQKSRRRGLLIPGLVVVTLIVGAVGVVGWAWKTNPQESKPDVEEQLGVGTVRLVGYLPTGHLEESSGLAASQSQKGVLWSHNDSGSQPVVHCLTTGAETCGKFRVRGATALDWESISLGPGPLEKKSYLYIADIGDNARVRDHITIYRVPEPQAPAQSIGDIGASGVRRSAPADSFNLTYPKGAQDAEALLVHPATGDLYIVTKRPSEGASIFKAAWEISEQDYGDLLKIAHLSEFRGISSITGGDISSDGSRVVLSTYGGAFQFRAPTSLEEFDSVWKSTPQRLALGLRVQGESIAYSRDGTAVYATSEMTPVPLWMTSLP